MASTARQTAASLDGIGLLDGLDTEALARLEREVVWRPVIAGQQILDHLVRSSSVYLVLEGQMGVRIAAANGREVTFRVVGAGGHFGELAVLNDAPRTATVMADTDGLLAEIAGTTFLDLLARHHCVSLNLLRSLARNVTFLTDRVFKLSTLDARIRLCAELLHLARDGEVVGERVAIVDAPTHEQLAALIGGQRECVSRDLRWLAQVGVISYRRREITILAINQLRGMLDRDGAMTATHLVKWSV